VDALTQNRFPLPGLCGCSAFRFLIVIFNRGPELRVQSGQCGRTLFLDALYEDSGTGAGKAPILYGLRSGCPGCRPQGQIVGQNGFEIVPAWA